MAKVQPKVTLINVTQDAAEMLILAKSTRLEMNPSLIANIMQLEQDEMEEQLEYIANTIPASWEFVDFIFLIQDVTRAFTHQFVRGRHASYAQQTMRVLDVGGWKYATGPSIENASKEYNDLWHTAMTSIASTYRAMVHEETGIKIEDARGILPTNILTNILVKMNLRTLVETVRKRSSSRVQGEYREVVKQLKAVSIAKLPWVEKFVDRTFDRAAAELEEMINGLSPGILGSIDASRAYKLKMVKLLDQMRMQS